MATIDKGERKYLHAARVVAAGNESSLLSVSELVDQGNQVVVLIPYDEPRETYDALTEQLIEIGEQSGATVSVVQVGITRPKGWRRWLARLNATRALIITPKALADPTVVVTWVPEANTGTQRLVVGEFTTMGTGHQSP